MSGLPVCIFCESVLSADTSPEHILLSALGGRKTTKRAICSKHNNFFGGTIDAALSEQVQVVRNLMQLESGTGKPPPAVKNLQAGSERFTLASDGRPKLRRPPFTVTDLQGGDRLVEINFEGPEDLRGMLPHLAAKLRISEDQLVEQIRKNPQAKFVEKRLSQHMGHRLPLGGEEALRSITKSCLVLLAEGTGSVTVRDKPFVEARDFVLEGNVEFGKKKIQIDSRDVPEAAEFARRFGNFHNIIYVRSDSTGRVIGHFTLYNLISWQIVLAEMGGPPDVQAALANNPLSPACWSDVPSAMPDIPFEWLASKDRNYNVERVRDRIWGMLKHHVDEALKSEISRIVDEGFKELAVPDGGLSKADAKMQKEIIGKIAERCLALALGLTYERSMTASEIDAMLDRKK